MQNPNHYAGTRNFIIGTTRTQRTQLQPFFNNLAPGGAIIAQVFKDGIRCKCITLLQAHQIAAILGNPGFITSASLNIDPSEGTDHEKSDKNL